MSKKINLKNVISIIQLCIIVVLSGCNQSVEVEGDLSENSHPFFPLVVGNKWYYNEGGVPSDSTFYNLIYEVVGSKNIYNKNFYIIQKSHLNENGLLQYLDSTYYSISQDTLFTFLPEFPPFEERVIILTIFNMEVDESFVREGYDELTSSVIKVTKKTESEMFFYCNNPLASDADFIEKYVKGEGLYERRSLAWSYGIFLVKTELK